MATADEMTVFTGAPPTKMTDRLSAENVLYFLSCCFVHGVTRVCWTLPNNTNIFGLFSRFIFTKNKLQTYCLFSRIDEFRLCTLLNIPIYKPHIHFVEVNATKFISQLQLLSADHADMPKHVEGRGDEDDEEEEKEEEKKKKKVVSKPKPKTIARPQWLQFVKAGKWSPEDNAFM